MANFLEIVFLAHIIITLGVTLYKTYNILQKGEEYPLGMVFLLFIVFAFGWFLGLVVILSESIGATTFNNLNAFSTIFIFTTGFFVLNILYSIVELILHLNVFANKNIQAYNSFKEYKLQKR